MTDEKNLVEVTIRVDMSAGVTLDHVCAKCGTEAKSVPVSYDCRNFETGQVEVFTVRSAMPPKGWEHLRLEMKEETEHIEVCPDCIREFFLENRR